ncbi:galactose-3-o-sulfotransferase 3 [Plakobranchus ocellatus]|uniref:Galactose-3-o-sulfotransferase 3 n=1 Tax=Plakobranchus ocellatus TaxID=259542 RepID=A0AAV4B0V7_9GAST|nr:galactose-3-o-sulfotransferase 3 [Plakobranchus ocellatus]
MNTTDNILQNSFCERSPGEKLEIKKLRPEPPPGTPPIEDHFLAIISRTSIMSPRKRILVMIFAMFVLLNLCLLLATLQTRLASFGGNIHSETKLPEIRQLVFAKVHKAASSTVQNIMLRFAMARDLTVLLPVHTNVLNDAGSKISISKVVPHPRGQLFDMLCSHVLYNESEIGKYVPKTAFSFAILREPMKQALSALKFYTIRYPSKALKYGLQKHPHDPINGFLQHPEDFSLPDIGGNPAWSFVNNRMSMDLGFDLNNFESSKKNTSKIQAFLKRLEKQFDVILISEYFDESIVLLRRLLRWSMKDIVYFKVNTAILQEKESIWNKKPVISATTTERFRQWNRIDYELYDHFLPIFKEKIRNEYLFQDEVNAFQKIQHDIRSFCSTNKPAAENLRIQENLWTKEFLISKSDCKLMLLTEVEITEVARKKQIDRYRTYLQEERHKIKADIPAPEQSLRTRFPVRV